MLRWVVAAVAGIALTLISAGAQAETESRVALVIGNGAYQHLPRLANPTNDAQLIATTLKGLGFTLIGGKEQTDLDQAGFLRAIREFGAKLSGGSVGLFYYAGHGVQVQGANYLVPVGANPTSAADVDFELVNAELVLKQMETAGSKLNFVILDACRNNPFGGRGLRDSGGGLAQMHAPTGTLISYATQPGNVARDGANGHSPFTQALADAMRQPGLGVFDVFNTAAVTVKNTTGGDQQPWVSNSPIEGNFYFLGPTNVTIAPQPNAEIVFWQSISASNNIADFEEYLQKYPNGQFAGLARNRLITLRMPLTVPQPPTAPAVSAIDGLQKGKAEERANNFTEALRWYRTAAELGNADAQFAVGRFYSFSGYGVEKNDAEALRWFKRAGDQGDITAQKIVASRVSDDAEKMRWYRKAAVQGDGEAEYEIGSLYASGRGVPRDLNQARGWFKKAAAAGYEKARNVVTLSDTDLFKTFNFHENND